MIINKTRLLSPPKTVFSSDKNFSKLSQRVHFQRETLFFVHKLQKSGYNVQDLSIVYISLFFEVVSSGNRAYAAHI